MKRANENIKAIVKTLEQIGYSVGVETVFRDWCECCALAIANGCDLPHGEVWERREKRYLDIIGKYKKDALLFPDMLAHLTNAFETEPLADHLGCVYMECFGGNKNLGQCFTPQAVCEACAKLVDVPKDHETHTLYEPACGGGAMIIAYLKACFDAGYEYQRLLKIYAADLDSLCCHMCYVQLSLLGARATVAQQNTLTLKTFDVFKTPMEMLWPMTLSWNETDEKADEKPDEIDAELYEILYGKPEKSDESTEPQERETHTGCGNEIQLKLF